MKLAVLTLFIFLIGTSFGQVRKTLKTVSVGDYNMTTKNYIGTQFRNGDKIKFAENEEEWEEYCEEKTPAYCYFEFASTDAKGFGCYYNWYAINDLRGLAPKGFHVPSYEEMDAIRKFLPKGTCGKEIKSKLGWGGSGNNDIGLNIIPSGSKYFKGDWSGDASFWTSTGSEERGRALAFHIWDTCEGSIIGDDPFFMGEWSNASNGISLRLIKDTKK